MAAKVIEKGMRMNLLSLARRGASLLAWGGAAYGLALLLGRRQAPMPAAATPDAGESALTPLQESARRALAMKQAEPRPERPETRTAHEGMRSLPNTDIAPSGALEQEGHRPVLERSRKVR
jgi:hypothetical protein